MAQLDESDHLGLTPTTQCLLREQAIGYDVCTGFHEVMHPGICQSPMALQCAVYKAKKSSDPDYPMVRQALTGPNADLWWEAMDKELQSIIDMDSWEIVPRSSLPKGTKVIPGTWALHLKWFPDGRVNKFKARYCVMGSVMPKGTENWSPVVGWPTV